jgi:hypothetical protein
MIVAYVYFGVGYIHMDGGGCQSTNEGRRLAG